MDDGALDTDPSYPPRAPFAATLWSVADRSYFPVEFTHPMVFDDSGGADPPMPSRATVERRFVAFQRSKLVALKELDDSPSNLQLLRRMDFDFQRDARPVNPHGRTGVTGRGLLPFWGPNHVTGCMLTRMNAKTNTLEYLGLLRTNASKFSMPTEYVAGRYESKSVPELCRSLLHEQCGNSADAETSRQFEALCSDLFSEVPSYVGVVCDDRTTDNAWVEGMFVRAHVDEDVATRMALHAGPGVDRVEWIEIHDEMIAFANHAQIIRDATTPL